MKDIKSYILLGVAAVTISSCNDFLDTAPRDALSPATTWQTEDDAQNFVVGCYDGWEDGTAIMYWDCASDFGYNHFTWEGFTCLGDGTVSPGNVGWSFYNFSTIRKCNTFLENVDKCDLDEDVKKDLVAQVKTIRAYRYLVMGFLYGGVPLIENYSSAEEAQVPRNTETEVQEYVYKDLNEAIADINETPSARGRFAKGAALGFLMRASLYWGDYSQAKDAAQRIIDLGQYSLEPGIAGYQKLFTLDGRDSKEIIVATQYLSGTYSNWCVGVMYNNGDGGWSSIVPTQNLIDEYEMSNGMTIDEAGSGYDPTHPFYNRDPRMEKTVIFPGRDWNGEPYNTLDLTINGSSNPNYPGNTDNSSYTALTWAKYLDPMEQYSDVWDTDCSPIVLRYADVLITWAECENELNGPSAAVYEKIDMLRERVGMPKVNQSKYNTKDKLRELIRRERAVELAGEGRRRFDILRWTDSDGKMVAETVMNQTLTRIVGTIDYSETDQYRRAVIDPTQNEKIEDRVFHSHNRYLPIPQENIDSNPKLKQNPGYSD